MPRNMFDGVPVFVTLASPTVRYAFKSRVEDETKRTALGQTEITKAVNPAAGTDGAIVVSPSFPKPPRASKKFRDGYTGSYCSSDKVATLKSDGWVVTKGKTRFGRSSNLTATHYVKINGIKYAWDLSKLPDGSYPQQIQAARITSATEGAGDLIWAPDFPRPPRMKIATTDGSFSTFFDPDTEDALNNDDSVIVSKSGYLHSKDQLLELFGIAAS